MTVCCLSPSQWSDSDIKSWFNQHTLVPSPTSSSRQRALDSIRRSYGSKSSVSSWTDVDLQGWLEDHGLKSRPKATHEQLVEAVQDNWDAVRSYVGNNARAAQTPFVKAGNAAFDAWTESQLREYRA